MNCALQVVKQKFDVIIKRNEWDCIDDVDIGVRVDKNSGPGFAQNDLVQTLAGCCPILSIGQRVDFSLQIISLGRNGIG